MLGEKYKLTLISVKEGCFWYPTPYECINFNLTCLICLKQKKAPLYSVYTTVSANKSRTLFQVYCLVINNKELGNKKLRWASRYRLEKDYCLLLQRILNWGKSYIYVPGNMLTISPTPKMFRSHTENTQQHFPRTKLIRSFNYMYCTHRISGYTLLYLGRGNHLQLLNKWTIRINLLRSTYYAQHYKTQPTTTAWIQLWRQTKTLA